MRLRLPQPQIRCKRFGLPTRQLFFSPLRSHGPGTVFALEFSTLEAI